MTRLSGFSSPLMLGFEELERVFESVTKKTGDGYPPYNIEHKNGTGETGRDRIIITLAVAGFREEDLEIDMEENQLNIRGCQIDDTAREYLHRGIAARQFQRSFVLADGIEVKQAELSNGLLSVELVRVQPQKVVQKISIKPKE